MHVFNLQIREIKRQIVVTEIPNALYSEVDQLLCKRHRRFFRYAEYGYRGQIFAAKLVERLNAPYRNVFNNLTYKRLLAVEQARKAKSHRLKIYMLRYRPA